MCNISAENLYYYKNSLKISKYETIEKFQVGTRGESTPHGKAAWDPTFEIWFTIPENRIEFSLEATKKDEVLEQSMQCELLV